MKAEERREACEKHFIDKLLGYGYISKTEEGYVPAVIVFNGFSTDKYFVKFNENEKTAICETAKRIKSIISEVNVYSRTVTRDDLPKSFRSNDNFCEFACMNSGLNRKFIFAKAIEHGWLKYNDAMSRVIGAYLYI